MKAVFIVCEFNQMHRYIVGEGGGVIFKVTPAL